MGYRSRLPALNQPKARGDEGTPADNENHLFQQISNELEVSSSTNVIETESELHPRSENSTTSSGFFGDDKGTDNEGPLFHQSRLSGVPTSAIKNDQLTSPANNKAIL